MNNANTENKQETKDYIALQPLKHNATSYDAGAVIALNDNDALYLLKASYVRHANDADGKTENANDTGAGNADAELQKTVDEQADEIARLQAENEQLKAKKVETPPAEQQPVEKPDYSKMTKADLSSELTKRGVEHDASAKNADLEALLVADDAKQAGDA